MSYYPPTTEDITAVITKFPYMVGRASLVPDANRALSRALGAMAVSVPQAAEGSLDPNLTLAAWAVCLDLAVWYIRYDVERNPDSGAPPTSLTEVRREIDDRISALSKAAVKQDGIFAMEPYRPLRPVPLPRHL